MTTLQYLVQGFVLLQLYHEFIVFSYGLITHICQDCVSGTVAIFAFCSKNEICRIAIQTIFFGLIYAGHNHFSPGSDGEKRDILRT